MFKIKDIRQILIVVFFVLIYSNFSKEKNIILKKNNLNVRTIYDLFVDEIKNNTILIFEPSYGHHECIPGFVKYFIELRYNVDILVHASGFDCLNWFRDIKNIRLFIFDNIRQINENIANLSLIIKKYDYILLQTTDNEKKYLM